MLPTENFLREIKSVPSTENSCENINEESLQQVSSAYAWQRKTNDWLLKQVLSQSIAGRPLNITSTQNNFKSLINKVYQKGCTHTLNT